MSAQGIALGNGIPKSEAPKRAALIPDIPFIQFNVMAITQGAKLILKGDRLVMLLLIGNVILHLRNI